jgi:hypothetical protein
MVAAPCLGVYLLEKPASRWNDNLAGVGSRQIIPQREFPGRI